MRVQSRSFLVVLLLALCLPAACAPPPGPTPTPTPEETDLPFETIDQGDSGYNTSSHLNEPQRMFLIQSSDEIPQIPSGWISRDAEKTLAQLDYQSYFALALVRDHFPSSGYEVVIERVGRRNGELVVHAQLWDPDPFRTRAAIGTRPYHVIKVLRDGKALEEAHLVLEVQTLTPTPPAAIRRLTPGSTP